MIAEIRSGGVAGIEGYGVSVEVDLARGLPSFTIVGLPNAAVRESRERVSAALRNNGFKVPQKRITVNLAPADMRKEGGAFDLPIAVGILLASGQLEADDYDTTLFLGELALDGRLGEVNGVLPVACYARQNGIERIVIPEGNGYETSFVSGIEVAPCRDLGDVIDLLSGGRPRKAGRIERAGSFGGCCSANGTELDYSEVFGQYTAKRGLQVAAAGGHHVLMIGPPGAGKTMLARRLPTIMPPMDEEEALELAIITSVTGMREEVGRRGRPFRAPHHSASDAGLVGGGRSASPGEITLAHNGILFLDEFTEFRRNVLEALRQPVEEGDIVISRANASYRYPARFQLVAAMNPCPCGFYGCPERECRCTPLQVRRYLSKVSGPLLDRIAIHLSIMAVPPGRLSSCRPVEGNGSARMREEVLRAVDIQKKRYAGEKKIRRNADLSLAGARRFCKMDPAGEFFLSAAQKRLKFSARSRKNIIQTARTISDLEESTLITEKHISEAVQYRVPAIFTESQGSL